MHNDNITTVHMSYTDTIAHKIKHHSAIENKTTSHYNLGKKKNEI